MSALPPFSAGYRLRPSSNKIAIIGHSMGQQAITDSTAGATRSVQLHACAFPAWLGAVSKGRYTFPEDAHFAVASTVVKDIYATPLIYNANGLVWNAGSATTMLPALAGKTQLQAALASPAQVVIVWNGGHNDIVANRSSAWVLFGTGDDGKGLKYVVDTLTAAGKIVVLMVDPPSGNSGATAFRYTASQLRQAAAIRNWILKAGALYPGQVFPVDTYPDLTDHSAAATIGDNVAAYFQDSVHTNALGAVRLVPRVQRALDSIGVPLIPPRVHAPADYYASDNTTGNLILNGSLYGTTGAMPSAQGGVTFAGVGPVNNGGLSWSATGGAQAGTLTVTGSMVSTATGNWFQVVIAGTTAANASPRIDLVSGLSYTNLQAGDVIASYGEWEVDPASTGFEGVMLRSLLARSAGFTSDTTMLLAVSDVSAGLDPTTWGLLGAPASGTWNGDLVQNITGTETGGSLNICFCPKPSSTVNATIRVRNIATRKVQ